MDCTYKTNKHDMPLFNIITMTGFNTVIPVAQCWISGETKDDYTWALSTLRSMMNSHGIPMPHVVLSDRDLACMYAIGWVFPEVPAMICRWHMNQNVLAKTRQVLGQVRVVDLLPFVSKYVNSPATDAFMTMYYDAATARTQAEFELKRVQLHALSKTLGSYLDQHWWKYKTRIVRFWTDQYHHFGYQDTFAVEGTHARIKKWLQSSRGDLLTAFKKLQSWWAEAARSLTLRTERGATIIPQLRQLSRYSRVVLTISRWALQATHEQWCDALRILKNRLPESTCSGVFRVVYGRLYPRNSTNDPQR